MTSSEKPNILILVFTRTLREFIVTGGNEYSFSSQKVQTLDRWRMEFLREQGVVPASDDDFSKKREKQLAQIQKAILARGLGKQYQAIFLDEAQDYLPGELDVFFKLGDIVFGSADSRQQIYPSVPNAKSELIKRFNIENIHTLKHHYRNGHAICKVADKLAESWVDFDKLMPTSNYPESDFPSSVTVRKCDDIPLQVQAAVDSLRPQLKAYPNEYLAILCPAKDLEAVWKEIEKSEIAHLAILQSSEGGYQAFDDTKPVCVCSIHGAKGLEFRAVHLINSENIGKSSLRRNITYMAVTRAKTSLTFYHSADLPPYLQEALLALKPAAPIAKLAQLFKTQNT